MSRLLQELGLADVGGLQFAADLKMANIICGLQVCFSLFPFNTAGIHVPSFEYHSVARPDTRGCNVWCKMYKYALFTVTYMDKLVFYVSCVVLMRRRYMFMCIIAWIVLSDRRSYVGLYKSGQLNVLSLD